MNKYNNDLSFGKLVAQENIIQHYLNNEKIDKKRILENNIIELMKNMENNEFLKIVGKDYEKFYNELVLCKKNKKNAFENIYQHLNSIDTDILNTASALQELEKEKYSLLNKIDSIKFELETL